ncbi:unnamed protein product [Nezara viridula]|uniref:Uncharacterized protein n=1 Tax=Nezara viridula TaxID=85310 RepID=A0A9P0E3R3_NEZVI|nr:unnamed protein product [Nezara viridula]
MRDPTWPSLRYHLHLLNEFVKTPLVKSLTADERRIIYRRYNGREKQDLVGASAHATLTTIGVNSDRGHVGYQHMPQRSLHGGTKRL